MPAARREAAGAVRRARVPAIKAAVAELVSRAEVLQLTGLAAGTLQTLLVVDGFPEPVQRNRWVRSDVLTWLAREQAQWGSDGG